MALSSVCFVPSKLVQYHHSSNIRLLFGPKTLSPTTTIFSSSCAQKPTRESNESPNAYPATKITCLRKRVLNLFIVAVTLSLTMSSSISKVTAQDLELERYTDSKQGFTLLRPPSWVKVSLSLSTHGIFSRLIDLSIYLRRPFCFEGFKRG